jgi:hypothetical protein
MTNKFLFAIDAVTEEVIVSESPKGSMKITFIERISRKTNDTLYQAVITLSGMAKSPDLDTTIFNAMDKVCSMLYKRHLENHNN